MKLYRDNIEYAVTFGIDRDALKQKDGQEMIDRQKMQRSLDMAVMLGKKKP